MSTVKILAIVLIVAGSLVYGGFTYTKDAHEAKPRLKELPIKDT